MTQCRERKEVKVINVKVRVCVPECLIAFLRLSRRLIVKRKAFPLARGAKEKPKRIFRITLSIIEISRCARACVYC